MSARPSADTATRQSVALSAVGGTPGATRRVRQPASRRPPRGPRKPADAGFQRLASAPSCRFLGRQSLGAEPRVKGSNLHRVPIVPVRRKGGRPARPWEAYRPCDGSSKKRGSFRSAIRPITASATHCRSWHGRGQYVSPLARHRLQQRQERPAKSART